MKQTMTRNSIKYYFILLMVILFVGLFFLLFTNAKSYSSWYDDLKIALHYEIIAIFPHDHHAFTQGLVWQKNFLYEGTGLYGFSSLRKVELDTGKVVKNHYLSNDYFGEGITIFEDKIYQLTWREQTGFIYDIETFKVLDKFSYSHEGWGITHNGKQLIISDGSPILRFLDPSTMKEIKQVTVKLEDSPVYYINELEYIKGKIFTNIWQTNYIAIIDPESGEVTNWLDLEAISNYVKENSANKIDVLNGIAYDEDNDCLFITGKLWPVIFQIKILESKK